MRSTEKIYREKHDFQILMISRGSRDANRAKAAEHRLTFPIVLQQHWQASRMYGIFGTPVGYWVDEEGKIAAEVAVGICMQFYSGSDFGHCMAASAHCPETARQFASRQSSRRSGAGVRSDSIPLWYR